MWGDLFKSFEEMEIDRAREELRLHRRAIEQHRRVVDPESLSDKIEKFRKRLGRL